MSLMLVSSVFCADSSGVGAEGHQLKDWII